MPGDGDDDAGDTGDGSDAPYIVDYTLSYLDRYQIVRNYYMSIEDLPSGWRCTAPIPSRRAIWGTITTRFTTCFRSTFKVALNGRPRAGCARGRLNFIFAHLSARNSAADRGRHGTGVQKQCAWALFYFTICAFWCIISPMKVADKWKDYKVLATGDGMKLERWGEVVLLRPEPAGNMAPFARFVFL